MTRLSLAAILLAGLAGCATTPEDGPALFRLERVARAPYLSVYRFTDKERGVTCYVAGDAYARGISCPEAEVRVYMPLEPEGRGAPKGRTAW